MITGDKAPEWDVETWLNTDAPLSLQDLRGSVVVVHAFQMLCPGCVSHGIPQAKAIHQTFPPGRVQVVGLHTVFEHHAAMTEVALRAFMHEYRIHFPVGIDRADPRGNPIPLTMQAWRMQGTPTLFILDSEGRIRLHHFGQLDDLQVGAVIGQLMAETDSTA
ncbi:redoxin domain-containing protein [Castellaniella sp. MT123]|uniref:redoxin domain-containing protein n=1 Tax=Castellaniella sp. MT123 TaxID=3140381 RepID=UPI0031F3E6C8|nr:redoxin domain-containing protein [Castellaniella sp.]